MKTKKRVYMTEGKVLAMDSKIARNVLGFSWQFVCAGSGRMRGSRYHAGRPCHALWALGEV